MRRHHLSGVSTHPLHVVPRIHEHRDVSVDRDHRVAVDHRAVGAAPARESALMGIIGIILIVVLVVVVLGFLVRR